MRVGLFGLGEAGSLFASDLHAAGVEVVAFDPASVPTPKGVLRCARPSPVVDHADIILSLTAAADAPAALAQALDSIRENVIYADFSTGSAELKRQLSVTAQEHGVTFVDVALMAVVPGNGLRTRALASGSGADKFCEVFRELGMPIEAISKEPGEAATRKLLRSVFMKGLAAVVIESMEAAQQAGLTDWLWKNISGEITRADEQLIRRLVTGTEPHAIRRLHEMEASTELLKELGVEPLMTLGTVESLKKVQHQGLPKIPE